MRHVIVNIHSDVFQQVKPSKLPELTTKLEMGAKYSPYPFKTPVVPGLPVPSEIWAAHWLRFTNLEVHELLNKAIGIVKDTEEYAEYILLEAFDDSKDKRYSTPPGTVRFYAQDLICFYNGKAWRKINP
jgi:hypothetical protein